MPPNSRKPNNNAKPKASGATGSQSSTRRIRVDTEIRPLSTNTGRNIPVKFSGSGQATPLNPNTAFSSSTPVSAPEVPSSEDDNFVGNTANEDPENRTTSTPTEEKGVSPDTEEGHEPAEPENLEPSDGESPEDGPNFAPTDFEPIYDEPTGIGRSETPGEGKKTKGPEELDDAERSAGQQDQPEAKAAQDEKQQLTSQQDEDKSWYKRTLDKEGKSAKRWFTGRRRIAAGGGLVGTIVGLLLFFSFGAGPLQFVHLTKTELSHFAPLQSQSNDRGFRLARYVHYRNMGSVEKVNLGRIGNHYADKIEGSFTKAGIESSYNQTFGYREGLVIDPEKLPPTSDFGDLSGKSQAEIKTYFKENFNADVSFSTKGLSGKKFFVSTDGLNYRQNVSLTKSAVSTAGIADKYYWISARIMGERAGVTWHPIKKLDTAVKKKVASLWKSQQAKDVDKGSPTTLQFEDGSQSDPNATDQQKKAAAQNVADAENSTNIAQSEGRDVAGQIASGNDGASAKFADNIHVKLSAGGLVVIGLACTARGLGENIDNIKQDQVILPMIRFAIKFLAVGGQIMAGQAVDLNQLAMYSAQLNGSLTPGAAGAKTNALSAQPVQVDMGQQPTGPKPTSPDTYSAINKGNPFSIFTSGALGSVLSPVCGPAGSAIQLAISFFGGPVSTAIQTIVTYAIGPPIFNAMAHWFAHDAVNAFAQGVDAGYNIAYGSRLAANASATSAGGRVLSKSEEAQQTATVTYFSQKEFQSHSLAYRLFNPSDYRTPIGRLIDSGSTSPTQNLAKMGSALLNVGHMFGSITKLFNPSALAATPATYDYGFPAIGFSQAEMSNPLVANPYQNADQVVNTILPSHPDYVDRAKKCFGVIIDPTTFDITSWGGGTPQYKSDGLESSDCSDSSTDWLQTRFYIFDTQTAESAACYNGVDEYCSDVGFGSGSAATSTTGSESAGSQTASNASLVWPFATKSPSQYNRIDQGWDIQSTAGAPVYAVAAGTIKQLNPDFGCGFGHDYPVEVLDKDIGGPTTWLYYGHVHVLPSVVNQHVNAGQQIATANTADAGSSCGAGQNGSAAPAGWLEIGFAKVGTDAPVNVGGESSVTPAGQKMHDILINAPVASGH